MRKSLFGFSVIIIAFVILLNGCISSTATVINSNPNFKKPDSKIGQTAQKKVYSDKRIPEQFSKEEGGIVYNNYIASDYQLLYGGSTEELSFFKICDLLEIKTSLSKQAPDYSKPEYKYQGNFLPLTLSIMKGKIKLTLKVKGKVEDYIAQSPYPRVQYQVFKNGTLLKNIGIYQYKGQFYVYSLETLLKAMGINYYQDKTKNITYVGCLKPVEIKGRLLARTEIKLKSGESNVVKLLYNYNTSNKPDYTDIVVSIEGKQNYSYNVYDENNRGRSEYYYSGCLRDFKLGDDTLLQVSLSDTPMDANTDTAIFRFTSNGLEPVFNKFDYDICLNGNFSLETDALGNCTFKDKFNNISKVLDFKSDKKNTIFNVDLRDEVIETGTSGNGQLYLIFSAVDKINFFFVTIECDYINGRFKPVKALVADQYN